MNGEHLFWLAFCLSSTIIIMGVILPMKKCEKCGSPNAAMRKGRNEMLCIGCWNKALGKRPSSYRVKNTKRLLQGILKDGR